MEQTYPHRKREEVKLPFEEFETDFIQGNELYEAVLCSFASMPDYNIYASDNGCEINGVREESGLSRLLPGYSGPSITTEIEESGQYSHLTVNLSARNKPEMSVLHRDIESLETALEDYFDPKEELEQDYHIDNFGLNAIASYISWL